MYSASLEARRKYNLNTKERLSPFIKDYIVWFNVSSFMIPENVADVIWAWNKKYFERQIDKDTSYGNNSFWEVMIKGSLTKTTQMFMFVREYVMMTEDKPTRMKMQKDFMRNYPRLKPLALIEFFEALEADIDMRRDFDGDRPDK